MSRTFKPQIFLVLIFICVSFGCNSTDLPTDKSAPKTALPMPPTNGASINNLGWTFGGGKRNVFSDFKGKVLILDFYATWCEPCRRSVPHLVGLQQQYESQGLQVVGLNVGGEEDQEKVPDFANEFAIQYTLAKPDDELVTLLMANNDAIPQTFVFDRQGQLAERLIGFGPNAGERIDSAVAAALQTPAP